MQAPGKLRLLSPSCAAQLTRTQYDLKSVEQVVYDLTLRNLGASSQLRVRSLTGQVEAPAVGPPAKRQRSDQGETSGNGDVQPMAQ